MALFARHKVQYLAFAWVMGIFAAVSACVLPFADFIETVDPGILHPAMLFALTATAFLQSIYPLSIPMPGYLQWGRMWKYAAPIIFMSVLYVAVFALAGEPIHLNTWGEVADNFFSSDLIFRFALLGLSLFYVVNILLLPRLLLRIPDTPNYLVAYATALGLNACLYVWTAIRFSIFWFEIWVVIFTLLNLYMFFRVLENLALSLPQPAIKAVEDEPVDDDEEQEDFNISNQHRFERVEFWMQHHSEMWKDNTFGRDQLCEATGINRHLLLQSVRSQGYNNIHEYINVYRINELKRMIARGEARTLTACLDAGFGTIKTARSCFEKVTGESLDECLAAHK